MSIGISAGTGALIAGTAAAGTGVASALIGKGAAEDAAKKQQQSADAATQLQREMWQHNLSDVAPWREAGVRSLRQLSDINGLRSDFTRDFTMDDFQKDPGYDFRMKEGQKAIERSAAAKGGLQSGGTLKALARYGQDYASNEYQNAYSRFNADRDRRFNRLSSLAGLGQTANQMSSAASSGYANNVGDILMNNANAQGAAGIAGANAWGNSLNNIGRLGMDLYSMNQMQNWMDTWAKNQGAGGGASYGANMEYK